MKCKHCGSNCDGRNDTFLDKEIIFKTLNAVANKYDSNGIMICLTGGEPMLYSDIYDVIWQSKKLGFAVGITSNGTLIDEMAAECLAKSGLYTISISIDGLLETIKGLIERQCTELNVCKMLI